MNKISTIILQILIFLDVIYFAYINSSTFTINIYLLGVITGLLQLMANKNDYKNKIDSYAKKNEKLSQENEINTDDKAALERKIATLEIALQNALKNRKN